VTPAELSVKRPIFISCLVILVLVLGYISLRSLPLDLFPDITIPTVVIATPYAGSGPEEIETEVSKIIEDEISSISGIEKISSQNREGFSLVIAEFRQDVDIKFAEQQIRAKVSNVKRNLPDDLDEPIIRTVSPSDAPIMSVALSADLPDGKLFDLADDLIKPRFEQVYQVGEVKILGGRKREIHVYLDRQRVAVRETSATEVARSLENAGRNIPSGKTDSANLERTYRTSATFPKIQDIENTIVRAIMGGNAATIGSMGRVVDALEDESSRTYINGEKAILFQIYRQSGANTVQVADDVKSRIVELNKVLSIHGGDPKLQVVRDRSKLIRANVYDVYESIALGIFLTVFVVYLFLGSIRSTIITSVALPTSLLGAFIFMQAFGFTINTMSLLALSLVVGLLVDDAIVVRENIYRKIEEGMSATKAALEGTNEVTLAVIATTLTVLAVFGPIGNLDGITGQYFKQFGLTVCFAMIISLFDALTMAPMLSAYFAGPIKKIAPRNAFMRANAALLKWFDGLQVFLENAYESTLRKSLARPFLTLLAGLLIFVGSLFIARALPSTFIPANDNGEFSVNFDLPLGSSLEATDSVAKEIDSVIRTNPEVAYTVVTAGDDEGASNNGSLFVSLVSSKERDKNTSQMKDYIRDQLKQFNQYAIKVGDVDASGSSRRMFNMNITGTDLDELKDYSDRILARIKDHPALLDVDTSFRSGKPEKRVIINTPAALAAGVTPTAVGQELRTQIEGATAGVFREGGRDYDIRVRMEPSQRDLVDNFASVRVPNAYQNSVPLSAVARLEDAVQPANILRENRMRYVQITADIDPDGPGLGGAITEISQIIRDELPPPVGMGFTFVGQAERFKELVKNILVSLALGVLFIYLVLASLYESFITPLTIMMVIPLAACGAFAALYVTGESLNLFSMIGCVMLMGLATKNSILLIDYTLLKRSEGMSRTEALLKAGRTRLRPIIMTSVSMAAGMLPIAIGLNEASRGRSSLGVVVIGGTISSTILTLYVIPAAYEYIDRFQVWFYRIFNKYIRS
jgi:hydrophobic/amphiphilic exporter-1 (mainly G- bacteria), HAE1 family